jgi:hypothetical protein
MMDKFSDLDRHVEQHVQANMRELARLCRQPSIAAQGLGIRECAENERSQWFTRQIHGLAQER